MTTPLDYSLNLETAGYVQSGNAAIEVNQRLTSTIDRTILGAGLLKRTLDTVTPGRALAASLVGVSAAAAAQEQRMASLQAATKLTDQNYRQLVGTANALARQLGSQSGGERMVQTLVALGVNGVGSEKKIASLGKTLAQLSTATSTDLGAVSTSVVQLERTFGNMKLDPSKVQGTTDALTALSLKTGVSAQSVLDFSKNIAPLARQGGIGEKAVLGISTAFSKMGEDGYQAANVVNKVLADLNQSVRDGTPQLNQYAAIVGKTSEQFKALYKASPTEAISQVTEAIGRGGVEGQRRLDALGFDGVRAQRVLTQVSSQGGIRGAVEQALDPRNAGATQSASQEVMKGLNDNFSKISTAAGQVGIALGQPLLGPLTKFTDALLLPVTGLAKLASAVEGSRTGRTATQALGTVAMVAGGAFALRGIAGLVGGAETLRTSFIPRAVKAGMEAGAGREVGEFGAKQQARFESGEMGPVARRLYNTGYGVGQSKLANQAWAMNEAFDEGVPYAPKPAIKDRIKTGIARTTAYGSLAIQGYGNLNAEMIRAARFPDRQEGVSYRQGAARLIPDAVFNRLSEERQESLKTPYRSSITGADGGLMKSLRAELTSINSAGMSATETMRAYRKAIKASDGAIMESSTQFEKLKRAASGFAATTVQSGLLVGELGRRGVVAAPGAAMRLAPQALSAGLSLAGGLPGLAIAGAGLAASSIQSMANSRQEGKEEAARFSGLQVGGALNEYNESIGKAAENTRTLAEVFQATSKAVALSSSDVTKQNIITAAELQAANASRSSKINRFTGSDDARAAQINLMSRGGISPEAMSAIRIDLARSSNGEAAVNKVLGKVNLTEEASGGLRTEDVSTALSGIDKAQGTYRGGKTGGTKRLLSKLLESPLVADGPDWVGTGYGKLGGVNVRGDAAKQMDNVGASISAAYERQARNYGVDYAQQEKGQNLNAAFAAIVKTGNQDLIARASRDFGQQLTGRDNISFGKGDDLTKPLTELLRDKLPDAAKGINYSRDDIKASQQESDLAKQMRTAGGGALARVFSNLDKFSGSKVNQAVAASMDSPGNAKKFSDAVLLMSTSALEAGTSLTDLSAQNKKLLNSTVAGTNDRLLLAAQSKDLFRRNEANAPYQDSGVTLGNRLRMNMQTAQMDNKDGDPERQAQIDAAREGVQADINASHERLRQFVSAQREYQIQAGRARADFERNATYSAYDFNLNRARSDENYERNMARGQADFFRQRSRQVRDFNIQMARQAEQGAKSMYDPYKRIQVQATWEARTLLLNMGEQNAALQKQKANLNAVRAAGVSNTTIDQLGLTKTENSQQLDRLVGDLNSDPTAADALNKTVKEKLSLAKAIYGDPGNKEQQNARRDFSRSLGEQAADFRRSMANSRADYTRSMNQQMADYQRNLTRSRDEMNRTLKRQHDDIVRSQTEIIESVEDMQKDALTALEGGTVDFSGKIVSGVQSMVEQVKAAIGDPDFQKSVNQLYGVTHMDTTNTGQTGGGGGGGKSATSNYDATITRGGVTGGGYGERGVTVQSVQLDDRGRRTGVTNSTGYVLPGTGNVNGGDPIRTDSKNTVDSKGNSIKGKYSKNFRPSAEFIRTHPEAPAFNKSIAKAMAPAWSKGEQWTALERLWERESGWKQYADNPTSTAYGIPQAIKPDKNYAAYGADWRTNPATQIKWGLQYIKDRYTDPKGAWEHETRVGWYAKGSIFNKAQVIGVGEKGPEAVIPLDVRGATFLAMTMSQLVNRNQMRTMDGQRAATYITYDSSSRTYDHSVNYPNAKVTVVSNNPNDLARKMEAKARQDNLVSSGSSKRR